MTVSRGFAYWCHDIRKSRYYNINVYQSCIVTIYIKKSIAVSEDNECYHYFIFSGSIW